MKDTFTKAEIIEMLTQMQVETAESIGFIQGMVTQSWVIESLLGKKIKELGGEGVTIKYV